MIIKICGTSGSGKTWVMRQLIERLGPWLPQHVEGRKKPLWSISTKYNVAVMGHYESVCGGCDNIGSAPEVYKAILQVIEASKPRVKGVPHVLSEGLLWSEDVKWSRELVEAGYDVRSAYLATSAEKCLQQVGERQQERGAEPIDPERVIRKLTTRVGTIERARLRLLNSGLVCRRCSSAQAVKIVSDWLGYTPTGEK